MMLDRASLIPDSNPAPYCEGLLNSPRSQTPDLKNGSGQSTPGSGPLGLSKAPPSDRQLVAHARLMSILLASQDWQRETRRRSSSGGTATKPAPPLSMHSGEWLDELERWRRATLQHDGKLCMHPDPDPLPVSDTKHAYRPLYEHRNQYRPFARIPPSTCVPRLPVSPPGTQ